MVTSIYLRRSVCTKDGSRCWIRMQWRTFPAPTQMFRVFCHSHSKLMTGKRACYKSAFIVFFQDRSSKLCSENFCLLTITPLEVHRWLDSHHLYWWVCSGAFFYVRKVLIRNRLHCSRLSCDSDDPAGALIIGRIWRAKLSFLTITAVGSVHSYDQPYTVRMRAAACELLLMYDCRCIFTFPSADSATTSVAKRVFCLFEVTANRLLS